MKIPIYQIDAFTNHLFAGNPAAVCPLTQWLPNDMMQAIAAENNLSETAFFVPKGDAFEITWFTPDYEIDLCGHATLATAHVIWKHLGYTKDTITLHSRQSGVLTVRRKGELTELDFPGRLPQLVTNPPDFEKAFGVPPKEVLKARDYIIVLENEEAVKKAVPDYAMFANLDAVVICITAVSDSPGIDFVSRSFDLLEDIGEDPVTGSTHCSLVPYWAKKLGKKTHVAQQISQRGGKLHCTLQNERVLISGQAITYMAGEIVVEL